MDADNTIERCHEVTSRTLHLVFEELDRQGVALEGMLLKPNMVISGKGCPTQAAAAQVAELTVDCFLPARAREGAGHRVPLRRPVGGRGDGEPERDQPGRRPLAALVLVRAGAAGLGARGMGRGRGERRRRAGRVPAPSAHERARGRRRLERGRGAGRPRLRRRLRTRCVREGRRERPSGARRLATLDRMRAVRQLRSRDRARSLALAGVRRAGRSAATCG